jgi:putative addiction module component (TIGR02574 family)
MGSCAMHMPIVRASRQMTFRLRSCHVGSRHQMRSACRWSIRMGEQSSRRALLSFTVVGSGVTSDRETGPSLAFTSRQGLRSAAVIPRSAAVPFARSIMLEQAMKDPVDELVQQGSRLSPTDRARVAELLLASIDDMPSADVDAAWDAEIARRLAAYDRGEVQGIDAAEVFAKASRLAR